MKMDKKEVKACLRALLSSSPVSYNLRYLLSDFRAMTGHNLPLFGYRTPVEFLQTLDDTLMLFGDYYNPTVSLVESRKSSHITSLVDRQRYNGPRHRMKRIIFPPKKPEPCESFSDAAAFLQVKTDDPSHCTSFLQNLNSSLVSPAKEIASPPHQSAKLEKTLSESGNSDFFEDISDDENSFSLMNTSNRSGQTNTQTHVNDGIKNKLRELIRNYPDGLWCCELPELFLQKFHFVLDCQEFGYTSLIQMLSELPDVFRLVRPGNGDWILFDSSVPPSAEELKMKKLDSLGGMSTVIRENLNKLLVSACDKISNVGVELDSIPELYQKMFGHSLDYRSLGFNDLKSLLEILDGNQFEMYDVGGSWIVVPAKKWTAQPSISWMAALPPITVEDDIFAEIFPKDVVGPKESLAELDLTKHIAVGSRVKVCAAEVWSPQKFYLQLHKFEQLLNIFMDNLQKFYNVHLNKYKMPDATIRPKQVCVGLYDGDPNYPEEWHRVRIVSIINEKSVLASFVDYGTEAKLQKSQLRFLHRSFTAFPVQAFAAELFGVAPLSVDNRWSVSVSQKFLEYLKVPHLEAEMVEIEFKGRGAAVILYNTFEKPEININERLVSDKLAKFKDLPKQELFDLEEEKPQKEEKREDADTVASSWEVPDGGEPGKKCQTASELFEIPDSDITPGSTTLKTGGEDENADETVPKTLESQPPTEVKVAYEFEEVDDWNKLVKEEKVVVKSEDLFVEKDLEKLSISKTEEEETKSVPAAFLPGKGKRLPPGLEQAAAASFDFIQIQSQMMKTEEVKKKINLLSVELLTSNPNIKKVAMSDAELALKIAKEMADARISAEYSLKLSVCYMNALNALVTRPGDTANGFIPRPKEEPAENTYQSAPQPTEEPPGVKEKKENETTKRTASSDPATRKTVIKGRGHVRERILGEKKIHVIKLDNQVYVFPDELVRVFSRISSWEVAKRILHVRRFYIQYRVLNNKEDKIILKAIKSLGLSKGNSKVHLLPSDAVVDYLRALGCRTNSYENDFMKLSKLEEEDSILEQI